MYNEVILVMVNRFEFLTAKFCIRLFIVTVFEIFFEKTAKDLGSDFLHGGRDGAESLIDAVKPINSDFHDAPLYMLW
jgi:hypothetical protein